MMSDFPKASLEEFGKKVRPCPCGTTFENDGLGLFIVYDGHRQIECGNCGRRGMISDEEDVLIESWNFDYSSHDKEAR